jgi:hypothetical protein
VGLVGLAVVVVALIPAALKREDLEIPHQLRRLKVIMDHRIHLVALAVVAVVLARLQQIKTAVRGLQIQLLEHP